MANSAHAVQIIGKNSFQMCWDYPMSILQQGSYYRILNSEYVKVNQASYDKTNLSFSNDIFGQHSNVNRSYVFLQVVPSATMQDLPSRPIRVDISGQYTVVSQVSAHGDLNITQNFNWPAWMLTRDMFTLIP